MRRCRPWTTGEIRKLREFWPTTRPYQWVELLPGRSYGSIKSMASFYGLRKTYPSKHLPRRKIICDAHTYKTPYFDTPEFAQALRRQTDEAKQEQRGTASV